MSTADNISKSIVLFLCCIGIAFLAESSERKPNVIIILADDLGFGDIGGYFGGVANTPNLNRLAREGMLFTDFHANGPMCSPSRASLLTGRYPQRMGVETAQRHVLDLQKNRDEKTIAYYLHAAGYKTGIVGKWHLGAPGEGDPQNFGFDEFIGYYGGDLDYFSKINRYGQGDWWNNGKLSDEEGYVTDLITNHAIAFIEQNRQTEFFLFISHSAIHFPWQDRESESLWQRKKGRKYTSDKQSRDSKLGPNSPEDVPHILKNMIESLDRSIGDVLNAIRENGLDENTMVFFLSDNGGYIDYGKEIWQNVGSNGVLRGQKGDVWEGGHRVPAMIRWPGKIPALSVTSQTAMTMDILPTILELTGTDGVPLNNPLDGESMAELLLENGPMPERMLFWRIGNKHAVRYGYWKLIGEGGNHALYNLKTDINEHNNLIGTHATIENKLIEAFNFWEKDVATGTDK